MYKLEYIVDRSLDKFYRLKLCYIRAWAYIGIPIELTNYFLILSVYLKVNAGIDNKVILIIIFTTMILFALMIGHIDIKNRFAHKEHTVWNAVNPQITKILSNTDKLRREFQCLKRELKRNQKN